MSRYKFLTSIGELIPYITSNQTVEVNVGSQPSIFPNTEDVWIEGHVVGISKPENSLQFRGKDSNSVSWYLFSYQLNKNNPVNYKVRVKQEEKHTLTDSRIKVYQMMYGGEPDGISSKQANTDQTS